MNQGAQEHLTIDFEAIQALVARAAQRELRVEFQSIRAGTSQVTIEGVPVGEIHDDRVTELRGLYEMTRSQIRGGIRVVSDTGRTAESLRFNVWEGLSDALDTVKMAEAYLLLGQLQPVQEELGHQRVTLEETREALVAMAWQESKEHESGTGVDISRMVVENVGKLYNEVKILIDESQDPDISDIVDGFREILPQMRRLPGQVYYVERDRDPPSPQEICAITDKLEGWKRKLSDNAEDVHETCVMEISMADAEVAAIRRAMESARGNKRKAATLLKIGKSTFYRKIRRYGLTTEFGLKE